jgi:regulator of cell morphogenesis and NO signaling
MSRFFDKTLAEIVRADHRTASVFEKYDLDFCCKGKRSLEDVCIEKELPLGQLIAELEKVTNSCKLPVDYTKLSLEELSDHIVSTHHEFVRQELPQIFDYLQKVASKHGDQHPEMLKVFQAFAALKEEMEQHMLKEEKVLFPRISMLEKNFIEFGKLTSGPGYLGSPITVMEQEHDHAGSLMREIKQLTNNFTPPENACTTFRLSLTSLQAFETDLHEHVHLENNILFPNAMRLFDKVSGTGPN